MDEYERRFRRIFCPKKNEPCTKYGKNSLADYKHIVALSKHGKSPVAGIFNKFEEVDKLNITDRFGVEYIDVGATASHFGEDKVALISMELFEKAMKVIPDADRMYRTEVGLFKISNGKMELLIAPIFNIKMAGDE